MRPSSYWRFLRSWCFVLAFGILPSGTFAEVLAPGFSETTLVLPGVSAITDLEWAPDGSQRLFISQQNGVIRIVKEGVLLPTPFLIITPVYGGGENGLVGFCFDPNFASNGFLYAFVTVSSTQQQIQRYTAVGDVGTNKVILVGGLQSGGFSHNGGAIAVGYDGKLYFGIGDNDATANAGTNLTTFASKICRANLNGTVPALNPFADGSGGRNDYIWARGLRNPFKCTVQPRTGLLWVNVAGNAYEQVFLIERAEHAGWPIPEGSQSPPFIRPKIKYAGATFVNDDFNVNTAVRSDNVATFVPGGRVFAGEKVTITGVTDSSFNGSYHAYPVA